LKVSKIQDKNIHVVITTTSAKKTLKLLKLSNEKLDLGLVKHNLEV
jgi:hypothetical protein